MEKILFAFRQMAEPSLKLRGSVLYSDIELGEPVVWLEQGYSKIINAGASDRETIYSCAGPGTILGYSVLNGESKTKSSARMLTTGMVREFPKASFDQLLQSDHTIWRWLAQQEAKRRETLERRLEILGLVDANQRIRALLPHLVREFGFPKQPDGSYTIPLKQSELASFASVTRETASSTLNVLQREKLVEILRGRIVVPDLSALEKD
jgi:CRP/FNR family cyclic AMP-dependent transcriptional regulator